jgi:tetratricopeptide (TPR) repeat protein
VSDDKSPEEQSENQNFERLQRVRNLWYLNPTDVASNGLAFFSEWWSSRDWRKIAIIIPPFILLFCLGSLVLAGKLMQKTTLMGWYQNQSIKIVDEIVEGRKESVEPTAEQIAKADLMLSRILQLGEGNLPSRFYVAQQNIAIGRVDVARGIISQIAPDNRPGLAEAHEWMAKDIISRASRGEQMSQDVLRHHLQNSLERFDLNFEPALYEIYASMLDRDKRYTEAARLLTKAGEISPIYQLKVVDYLIQKKLTNQAKGSADLLVSRVENSIANPKSKPEDIARDVILAARAYTMTDRIDDSIKFLDKYRPTEFNLADWRRTLSENFRIKFRKSLVRSNERMQVNLNFLNEAIKFDPTNVAVQSELQLLNEIGIASTPDQRKSLVNLIAQQGSSLVPKILLAESALIEGRMGEAITYYELVLAEVPEFTIVLNNLAALLAKKTPPDIEKARELIDKAISITPNVAECRDTKGNIEAQAGNNDSAVNEYLKALELAPARLTTREKLIKLYESIGNESEATKQKEILQKVKDELARIQAQREKAIEEEKTAEPEAAIPSTDDKTKGDVKPSAEENPTPGSQTSDATDR